MSEALRPAILIVSDTASADPSTDKSGHVLKNTFAEDGAGKWREPIIEIVPDDKSRIRDLVQSWTDGDDYPNLVITTGGTGFATKDWTPEAIEPLLDRKAPGLVHAMLRVSFEVTPFAMMSRPVAGVRRKTIIITLPGSPKGAKENLQAVLKLLPHACMQAAGEDSRAAHVGGVKKLEQEAGVSASSAKSAQPQGHGHHHHHHHHDHHHHGGHGGHKVPEAHTVPSERPQSNDPRLGATARARASPYPMLAVADAVATILSHTPSPISETLAMTTTLTGAVVASDIKALEAVPAYRASIVDGYAVLIPDPASSLKGTFPVASVSHAQATSMPPPLEPNTIARITTGAPLPPNANAVVMVEDTAIASTTADKLEEATVSILTSELVPGENIREPGSDIPQDSVILRKGTRIGAIGGEIGLLAAGGVSSVPVFRRPRVGVMSTGDEVTDISYNTSPLSGGQIRDSNRPSLISLIRGWNLCSEVVDLGIARDTPSDALETALRDALRTHDVDVIITTGGVSMGELDLLKPTVERKLGGQVIFGRVSMKPGKPTTFASVPFKDSKDGERKYRLLFGLPGNPASAIVTANLFLLPCLQKMSGLQGKGLERVPVKLSEKVKCDPARVEYHRVVVGVEKESGRLLARSTGMQRSSRVGSLASANALLELPQKEGWLDADEICEALMMGPVLGIGSLS